MANKIKVVTADSKEALEDAVNEYMAEQVALDARVVVELAGGVICTNDATLWVAAVMLSAVHKRTFDEDGEDGEG